MTDDSMIKTVFQLCTEKPQDWIDVNKKKWNLAETPRMERRIV